jgi:hypothetical protein
VTEVLLNHFYVTPDRTTFEAASLILPELGALEKRTTVRKDMTYTGLYLYGQRTYLELLHPDSAGAFGAPSGIAWGVEEPGAIGGVFPGGPTDEVSRGQTPWFRRVAPAQPLQGLTEWAMEYLPDFFRGFHPELPPTTPGIARADALTRYAASCGKLRDREQGLFEDVIGLEVSLAAGDLERWNARALRIRDVDVRVRAARAGDPSGIVAARLRLRRDAGKVTKRIGSTTLSLDGRGAVWRFQESLHGELP